MESRHFDALFRMELRCLRPADSPSTIVAAKFAAAATVATLAALQVAAAIAWFGYGAGVATGPALASIAIVSWILLLVAASWLLLAVMAARSPEQLLGAPLAVFAVVIVLISVVGDRLLPHHAQSLRWFLSEPWAPEVSALALVVIALAVSLVAFKVTERGIVRYRAARDKLI